MNIILMPFAWVMQLFYGITGSYAISLVLFAIVIKLLLFPFSLKGKRSMIQMNMLQGRLQKLQKMYANNKEKYNEEVQKLYEKEKVKPMSGCLWSFLPLLFLIPLYGIIRQPLTYMMGLTAENINQVAAALNWNQLAINSGWIKEAAENFSQVASSGYNELYLASSIKEDAVVAGVQLTAINFDFLGLNMAEIPQLQFWTNGMSWNSIGLFLLPVISAISSVFFAIVSMRTNAINRQAERKNNTLMMLMSPLMSLWIGFSMPAGLCIYWIAQNLLSMGLEVVAGKMLKKDYEKAAEDAKRREAEEKEEEKRRKEEARLERARRLEEEKRNKGKKKKEGKKESGEAGIDKTASRVGLRAYARGRSYDPYRYSPDGPTPYREDGVAQVDDEKLEAALEKRAKEKEERDFAAKYALTDEELKEIDAAAREEVGKIDDQPEDKDGEDAQDDTEEI